MAHSLVTRPSIATVDGDRKDGEYDPYELSDEDDLRQGAAPARRNKRVVILFDLDCYEVQVWLKAKRPDLENLDVPIVVVNLERIILSVNYTARLLGVNRGKGLGHLEEMQRKHPQLIVIKTGELFHRQDFLTPQKRSDDILEALLDYQKTLKDSNSIIIERASKDEIYIDVTNLVWSQSQPAGSGNQVLRPPQRSSVNELTSAKKTHPNAKYNGEPCVVMEGRHSRIHGSTLDFRILEIYPKGLEAYHADETSLAHGAIVALELVKLIKQQTGFDSSAGVASNKLLAKLACKRNKPCGVTILIEISIPRLSKKLEFKDIPRYGGKIGEDLQTYFSDNGQKVKTLHDIITLPFDDLVMAFEAVGSNDKESDAIALFYKCRGQDDSIILQRHFTNTISASVNFRGTHYVGQWKHFKDRVTNLSRDVSNRIMYHNGRWKRSPQSLVVKVTMRKDSNVTLRGEAGRKGINGIVDATATAINGFIRQYILANGLKFEEIEEIKVTAAGFKSSYSPM